MFKNKKYFSIILSLIMSITLFVGCEKRISLDQYNQLENNFYEIYNPIVKDFYSEALQGANGQQLSNKLYSNHKNDIEKLKTILDIKENQVPRDKKDELQKMKDEYINILVLSSISQTSEDFDENTKQNTIKVCNNFLFLNKDK